MGSSQYPSDLKLWCWFYTKGCQAYKTCFEPWRLVFGCRCPFSLYATLPHRSCSLKPGDVVSSHNSFKAGPDLLLVKFPAAPRSQLITQFGLQCYHSPSKFCPGSLSRAIDGTTTSWHLGPDGHLWWGCPMHLPTRCQFYPSPTPSVTMKMSPHIAKCPGGKSLPVENH